MKFTEKRKEQTEKRLCRLHRSTRKTIGLSHKRSANAHKQITSAHH